MPLSAWSWCGVLKSSNALHTPSGETVGSHVHIRIQLGLGWHHLVKIPEPLKCSLGSLLGAFWIKGPWSFSEWSEVACCDFRFSPTANRDSRFASPSPALAGPLGGLLYCTLGRTWYNSFTWGTGVVGPGLLRLVRKEIRSLKLKSCAKNFTVEVALQEVNQRFQYFTGSNGLSEVIIICSGIYLLLKCKKFGFHFSGISQIT